MKKILIVEDDKKTQELLSIYIKNLNVSAEIEIDLADNGLLAIEQCSNKEYDLILMDIYMPKMNGYLATSKIRNLLNYKLIPIIALTGDNRETTKQIAHQAGMVEILVKPITKKNIEYIYFKYLH